MTARAQSEMDANAAGADINHFPLCAARRSHRAAINAGRADAWSCWLTRRLALAVLERTTQYLATTSDLAQRAPAQLRGEAMAFERDAAIVKTARAMSSTPPAVLQASAGAAELAERLTIARDRDSFRLELRGQGEHGAVGIVNRDELQRVLKMLHTAVMQAGWLAVPVPSEAASPAVSGETKPTPH